VQLPCAIKVLDGDVAYKPPLPFSLFFHALASFQDSDCNPDKMATPLEIEKPFAALDGRRHSSLEENSAITTVVDLTNADEALAFLTNHPRAAEITIEGNAILEDPVQLRKLVRKIDLTIAPLLAVTYFLQYLDKTTLNYAAVMGIRTDTHLKGQDYSNLSMLFYVGMKHYILERLGY
jgi:ACS family allantoate permease-like MFS transporter